MTTIAVDSRQFATRILFSQELLNRTTQWADIDCMKEFRKLPTNCIEPDPARSEVSMAQSESQPDFQRELLSIYFEIDEICKDLGIPLVPEKVKSGEVHFFDLEDGDFKFRAHQLSRRTEILEAIRAGWTPCSFYVVQVANEVAEMRFGIFSWIRSDKEECSRYLEERTNIFLKEAEKQNKIIRRIKV
jgi:hypothetical protein